MSVRLLRQYSLADLTWLIHDVSEFVVILHHVLHDVRLVTFQRQTQTFNLDDGIQQVEVVGTAVLQYPDQVNDRLDLLRKYLQTRALVPDECLEAQTRKSVNFNEVNKCESGKV